MNTIEAFEPKYGASGERTLVPRQLELIAIYKFLTLRVDRNEGRGYELYALTEKTGEYLLVTEHIFATPAFAWTYLCGIFCEALGLCTLPLTAKKLEQVVANSE